MSSRESSNQGVHLKQENNLLTIMDPLTANIPTETRILSSNDSMEPSANDFPNSVFGFQAGTHPGQIEPFVKIKTEGIARSFDGHSSAKDIHYDRLQPAFSYIESAQNYAAIAHSAAMEVLSSVSTSKSSSPSDYTILSSKNDVILQNGSKISTKGGYSCNVCHESFLTENLLKNHSKKHSESKPFKCDICNSTFSQLANMKTHQRIHTGERPFSCQDCGATFTQISNLKTHQKLHSGEKPFVCDICHARFTQLSNLKSHRLIHTGERPYKCDICQSSFVQSTHLRNHRRIHTNERPYNCDFCTASFRQLSNLRTHEKIHTGEKPHVCSQCNSAFAQKSNLKSHMLKQHQMEQEQPSSKRGRKSSKNHSEPFSCDICGAVFVSATNLKTHLRLHTGEKPYTCSICFMTFSQKSNLKAHGITHTDVKPYACPDCPSAFKQKANLRTHIIKKHNGCTNNFSPFLPNMTGSNKNIVDNLQFCHSVPSSSSTIVEVRSVNDKFLILNDTKNANVPIVELNEGKVYVKNSNM